MELIFENKYLTFELDRPRRVFFYRWKEISRELDDDAFIAQCRILHKSVLESKCRYIIGDDSEFSKSVPSEVQAILNQEMLLEVSGFIHKFAHIVSKTALANIAIEQIFEESDCVMFQNQFFDNLEAAEVWIYESAR